MPKRSSRTSTACSPRYHPEGEVSTGASSPPEPLPVHPATFQIVKSVQVSQSRDRETERQTAYLLNKLNAGRQVHAEVNEGPDDSILLVLVLYSSQPLEREPTTTDSETQDHLILMSHWPSFCGLGFDLNQLPSFYIK
jgi:hypothetical protein